ncbi:MAG TPA: MFS transporter, partial [Ilumatobacteraceae bacterium]|nr:MFS transporter [Ilumatobacteraceae bacterium]
MTSAPESDQAPGPNPGRSTSTFAAFHHRNFAGFFVGQLISQVGHWLQAVAQVLLVIHLTDNGEALGWLAMCQFAPVLLLGAWAGALADRSDKRRLLLWIQLGTMVQSVCMVLVAFAERPSLAAIYLLATIRGVSIALDSPARRSFIAELVPEQDVSNAVSLYVAMMTGARVVGPALAGILVTAVGFGWTFFADAASFLAVILSLVAMNRARLRPSPRMARTRGQVRESARYARGIRDLWIPIVMSAIIGTFAWNFQTV